jgi:DNA-binding transcriptional ArsR family regulator
VLNLIPEELKDAILALSHRTRLDIIAILQKSDLSYTQLLEKTGIQKGSLTNHLNKLMDAGLINNFSQGRFGGPYNSFYRLSRFGNDFLASLLSSIEIPTEPSREKDDWYLRALHNVAVYNEKSILLRAFEQCQPTVPMANKLFQIYDNQVELKYKHIIAMEPKHKRST